MPDIWSSRGKIVNDMSASPALQCRVYSRIALQDHDSITRGYCLEFSAGNSFDFGFCRKENVPSLLRDILTVGNTRVLTENAEFLMLPTVPTGQWVKQVRKYDPTRVVMWLDNSIELNEEYVESIIKLRSLGMKFAIRVDAMGNIASNEDVLRCLCYLLVDADKYEEYQPVIDSLKKQNPSLELIGYKQDNHIVNFEKSEIKPYKYVLGIIQPDELTYENGIRPKWQHEMLRTFAQLYSSIYDIKEIGNIVSSNPFMGAAMKGLISSKHLTSLTLRGSNQASSLSDTQGLSPNDLRNYMVISVAYNLFLKSEFEVMAKRGVKQDESLVNYEPFIQALHFAKVVDFLAQDICDDVTVSQGFIAGFLRYSHLFLHDKYENVLKEFPLEAVCSIYQSGGGQLGGIIRIVLDLFEHRVDEAIEESNSIGVSLSKEVLYSHISRSFTWTDAVLRAIGIIKSKDMEDLFR